MSENSSLSQYENGTHTAKCFILWAAIVGGTAAVGAGLLMRKKSKNGINLKIGRDDLDFGKGFYVTTDKKQAEMWASRKTKKAGNKQGVVMVFKVDDDLLDDYDGLSFNGVSDEWKTFVYNYRNGGQHHKYDFVTGPMLANPFYQNDGGPMPRDYYEG